MKLNFKPGEDKHPSLVNEPLILREKDIDTLTCTQCSCKVPVTIEFMNGDRVCAVCLTIAEVALRKELIDILIEEREIAAKNQIPDYII